jgi:asparagine synthase (glutamine-hydrolysing)
LVDCAHLLSVEELTLAATAMMEAIRYRGPDSCGLWQDISSGIALAHRRLSIIDLSPTGDQPMHSNQRYVVTFNGEIYNYRSLRQSLQELGHHFRGTSDTEVMLAAVEQWGVEESLNRFVGMFAFALWDKHERILYLARDRMGEKPLFYGWCGKTFLFGSELKALRRYPGWAGEIDRNVLALFFRFNYVPTPFSIYRNVYKLPQGTFLSLSANRIKPGELPALNCYWSLKEIAQKGAKDAFRGSEREAVDELDRLLRLTISEHMISDVPLGAFFSGGVDSSTVVAIMQAISHRPVRTFTMGFHDVAYNEANYAREVARFLGTEHTEMYIDPKNAFDVIPILPQIYDEPFADSSQIPTVLMARLARQHVTVGLSGDGGDEVFCGYNRQARLIELWNRIRPIPVVLRKGLAAAMQSVPTSWYEHLLRRRKTGVLGDQIQKTFSILGLTDVESMYLQLTYFWDRPLDLVLSSVELPNLLLDRSNWPQLRTSLDRMLYLESMTSLPDDMLVKIDRATMSVSLEARVPFLDHRIIEFVWKLPVQMKLRKDKSKWVLRQVLYRYVPRSLVERPKSGFGIPIDEWLKGPLRDWAEELLNESRISREGFLNGKLIRQKWHEHIHGYRKWQFHLWGVLMFEAWLAFQKSDTSALHENKPEQTVLR